MAEIWAHLHLPRYVANDLNCISLKEKGEKVRYVSDLILVDATFFISAAGRERCLISGIRNVHAWVIGTNAGEGMNIRPTNYDARRAIYDPWKGDSFVWADDLTPIHHAAKVCMSGKNVYVMEE